MNEIIERNVLTKAVTDWFLYEFDLLKNFNNFHEYVCNTEIPKNLYEVGLKQIKNGLFHSDTVFQQLHDATLHSHEFENLIWRIVNDYYFHIKLGTGKEKYIYDSGEVFKCQFHDDVRGYLRDFADAVKATTKCVLIEWGEGGECNMYNFVGAISCEITEKVEAILDNVNDAKSKYEIDDVIIYEIAFDYCIEVVWDNDHFTSYCETILDYVVGCTPDQQGRRIATSIDGCNDAFYCESCFGDTEWTLECFLERGFIHEITTAVG